MWRDRLMTDMKRIHNNSGSEVVCQITIHSARRKVRHPSNPSRKTWRKGQAQPVVRHPPRHLRAQRRQQRPILRPVIRPCPRRRSSGAPECLILPRRAIIRVGCRRSRAGASPRLITPPRRPHLPRAIAACRQQGRTRLLRSSHPRTADRVTRSPRRRSHRSATPDPATSRQPSQPRRVRKRRPAGRAIRCR